MIAYYTPAEEPYMLLYKAVGAYVEANGGKVILCSGIQVQEWPSQREGEFSIAVKCVGRIPVFKKDHQD